MAVQVVVELVRRAKREVALWVCSLKAADVNQSSVSFSLGRDTADENRDK